MNRIMAETSRDTRGFSLIELTIATALSLLVLAGLGSVLYSVQEGQADLQARVDAQQAARMALVRVQRDLQVAGIGLARLQPPFPVIVPRQDGIELRINRGQVTTFLRQDMRGTGDALKVDSGADFEAGFNVAVYDTTGDIELTEVLGVAGNNISHAGLSKEYTTDDGTAVARVEIISYTLEGDAPPYRLVRRLDGRDPAVLADGVLTFGFRYWDDSEPRQPFDPDTLAEQLRIRMVELELEVRSLQARLRDGVAPSFRSRARVAPRALTLF